MLHISIKTQVLWLRPQAASSTLSNYAVTLIVTSCEAVKDLGVDASLLFG